MTISRAEDHCQEHKNGWAGDLPDQRRPALGRDGLELLLAHPQRQRRDGRFPHLPPVGVGVQAIVPNHDLPLVGDMGGHPGDELQIIHRLLVGRVLTVSLPDLALWLQKRQPLQRQDRSDHALSHPLGFGF